MNNSGKHSTKEQSLYHLGHKRNKDVQIRKKEWGLTCDACMTVKTATEKKRQNSTSRKDKAPTWLLATWLIHAPKEDGAEGSLKTPACILFIIYIFRLKVFFRFTYHNYRASSTINILARVTPPVISIARTSSRRKRKNSHLFFCKIG